MADARIGDLARLRAIDHSTGKVEVEYGGAGSEQSAYMTIRELTGMGWGYYVDNSYTSGSPLAVNNAKVQLTIDGLGSNTEKSYLPVDAAGVAVELWDASTNKITPVNIGDSYDFRVDFKCSSSTANAYLEFDLDIGSGAPLNIVQRLVNLTKGTGIVHSISIGVPIFSLTTFISNGGKLFLDTSTSGSNVSVYDLGVFLKRDFVASV